MPTSTADVDWLVTISSLRQRAYRLRDEARTDHLGRFSRGLAIGLKMGADAIAGEIDEPVYLECEHRCRCLGKGSEECTACELMWLAHDPAALLKLADDRCACEHGTQCDACAIAAVVRHEEQDR